MFDSIATHLSERRVHVMPTTGVNVAWHPADVPWATFVVAHSFLGACMLSYHHDHCFYSEQGEYCDDDDEDLRAFVDEHLHLVVELDDEALIWIVATFSGNQSIVRDGAAAARCVTDLPEDVAPKIRTEVVRGEDSFTVFVTTVTASGALELHEVRVASPSSPAETKRTKLYTPPPR